MADSTLSSSSPTGAAIDPDLVPGQVVGEYQVEDKLGQGGFGAVFKAVHPLIGKQVAIKVLSHRFSVDPEMVSRFVAEARAVNQIRHHNIIDIFSFGTLEDGRQYYVMEYLDGEPLDQRIAHQGRLSLGEALPILRAIARALDAAHVKGIAHRDLKAENVFLAVHPDGVYPKLLDFGIAKLLAPEDELKHKTRTGAPMGTPHYMSPEQCHGRHVDHRTDIYAFGVLAYVMLTGTYPINGEDYMTILMRQVHDEPVPPSSHQPDLPEGIDRAIAWLMRKDPAARPATLIEAVCALEQAATGEETVLPTAATPGSMSKLQLAMSGLPTVAGSRVIAVPQSRTGEQSVAAMPPVSEIRRAPPHRLLAAGALIAAAAVAAIVIVRSVRRDDAPASTPADAAVIVLVTPDAAAIDAPERAAPPPALAAAQVYLTIEGTPPNTEVRRGGDLVGTVPGQLQLPRSTTEVKLVLTADGFAPETIVVIPSDDLKRMVKLKPRVQRGRPVPPKQNGSAAKGSDEPTNDIEQFPPPKP